MIEKLYTVEEVAELASVTGRTIRNYLKSGKLVGRKIGGQWRFPESEVQRLLSGAGDAPAAPMVVAAAPRVSNPTPVPTRELTESVYQDYPAQDSGKVISLPRHGAETLYIDPDEPDFETMLEPGIQKAQAQSNDHAAYYPQPPTPEDTAPVAYMPTIQPAPAQQAVAPPVSVQQPTAPVMPTTVQQVVPQVQTTMQDGTPVQPSPMVFVPQQASLYSYSGPYGNPPMVGPTPVMGTMPYYTGGLPTYAASIQPPPSFAMAAQPQMTGTILPPMPSDQAAAAPTPAAEEKPAPLAKEADEPAAELPPLSDVGQQVVQFCSEIHDCSQGPQICAVVDLQQTLESARHFSDQLNEMALQESGDSPVPCRLFVEYDERFFLARYTIFGTSTFLFRCMQLLG